jgi:hypothetical protein
MTEEEDDSIKEEDSITSLRELEEFVAISLLELDGDPGTESGMTTLEDEVFLTEEEAFEELLLVLPASPFLLLLEGRFPLEVEMTEEEDEDETYSSSFEDVPLSPPQANKEAQSAMLATTKMQLFKNDNLKSLINTPTTGKIYNFPIDGIYLTPS